MKRGIHEDCLEELVRRLREKGHTKVQRHVEYSIKGICGEMDVVSLHGGVWRYYEVKSSYLPKTKRVAIEQFERHRRAHGDGWAYILVTPYKVQRIHI